MLLLCIVKTVQTKSFLVIIVGCQSERKWNIHTEWRRVRTATHVGNVSPPWQTDIRIFLFIKDLYSNLCIHSANISILKVYIPNGPVIQRTVAILHCKPHSNLSLAGWLNFGRPFCHSTENNNRMCIWQDNCK